MSAVDTNRELVAAAFERWAAGTGSFFDLLADDVQWTITGTCPISGTYRSRRQFLDEAIAPLSARLAKPITPALRSLCADGDWVVALWDGTALATDGAPYDNSYSWHMRFQDARIVEVVAFFDGIELAALFERVPLPERGAG